MVNVLCQQRPKRGFTNKLQALRSQKLLLISARPFTDAVEAFHFPGGAASALASARDTSPRARRRRSQLFLRVWPQEQAHAVDEFICAIEAIPSIWHVKEQVSSGRDDEQNVSLLNIVASLSSDL